jgi:hypothetical protein
MKTRIMLGALIMAAVIGSSVGVGYAGGGDSGLPGGALLWHCYVIRDGDSPSLDFTVDDVFTATPQSVSVSSAQLLCTPADGTVVRGGLTSMPLFFNQRTCYEVSPVAPSSDSVTLTDPFVESQTIDLHIASYLCTQALCEVGNCATIQPPTTQVHWHCYDIVDGASPSLTLSVNDKLDNFPPPPDSDGQRVRVGRARLLCTPANVQDDNGVVQADQSADQFACYNASSGGSSNAMVTLKDPFVASQTVQLGSAPYLCTEALCTDGNCAAP